MPGLRARQRGDIGRLHTEHDIRTLDRFRTGNDLRPGLRVSFVGDRRPQTRSLFNNDHGPERGEFLRRFGRQRNPALARRALFKHRDT